MTCHHYCNEPLRCPTCIRRFWAWASARTNSPPPRRYAGGPSFYAAVNVIAPPLQVEAATK
jgi:hypothetical protein